MNRIKKLLKDLVKALLVGMAAALAAGQGPDGYES